MIEYYAFFTSNLRLKDMTNHEIERNKIPSLNRTHSSSTSHQNDLKKRNEERFPIKTVLVGLTFTLKIVRTKLSNLSNRSFATAFAKRS